MITFENKTTIIIPLAYNIFINTFNDGSKVPRFDKDNMLEESDIDELVKYINNINNSKNDVFVAIDMEYISFYKSRMFKKFDDIKNLDKVFFFNINTNTDVGVRIAEDTSRSFNYSLEINRDKLCFSSLTYGMITEINYQGTLHSIILEKVAEIVKGITEEKIQFLESSGVWSNRYVDLKKLFLNSNDYMYIIYKMAETSQKYYDMADALISTSKTGSVFANLVGQLLNKKVVHCVGVGPKFTLSIDEVKNNIRKGKKYLYICDFICLGTELRILNALIKSENAEIIGGVGVATFINTNSVKLSNSIVGKIKCLINILDYGVDYKIGMSKEELMEENKHGDK